MLRFVYVIERVGARLVSVGMLYLRPRAIMPLQIILCKSGFVCGLRWEKRFAYYDYYMKSYGKVVVFFCEHEFV